MRKEHNDQTSLPSLTGRSQERIYRTSSGVFPSREGREREKNRMSSVLMKVFVKLSVRIVAKGAWTSHSRLFVFVCLFNSLLVPNGAGHGKLLSLLSTILLDSGLAKSKRTRKNGNYMI